MAARWTALIKKGEEGGTRTLLMAAHPCLQILEENIRVTSLVSQSLQRRVHGMALSELGAFLRRSAKALTHPQTLALLLGQPRGGSE